MFGSILKHPGSISKCWTGQSTGQRVPHGNCFPSAGWYHFFLFLPSKWTTLQIFFFTRDATSCPSRPFPFWMRQCSNAGFRSHWGKQEKKISLQGKERIISLICICNSSSSILIEDFEHHHGMPILASFFSERWSSWQHLLTTNTTEINSYVLIGLAILQKCA